MRATHSVKEPLLNQQMPKLTDPAVVKRLSLGLPAGVKMLKALELTREEQAWLLGLSTRTLQRSTNGMGPELNQDQLTRLSLVVGIYKALHILYDAGTAKGWLKRSNRRYPFAGDAPLEYMRQGGIPAMYEVRRLLDGDRSGMFSITPEARREAAKLETVIDL